MDFENIKYVVVGSGFFGSVIAERLANDLGENVIVLEERDHVGGNSFSYQNKETGIEVHKYGSHIFHTSNKVIWDYINRFSGFNTYRHKVKTLYEGRLYSMPINLNTINDYYGLNLTAAQAQSFIESEIAKEKRGPPQNLEEKAISLIGRPLYEAFVKGYTVKQWDQDPLCLPPEIISRLPVRYHDNTDYFDDPYQGIPLCGYGKLFEKILKNPKIHLHLKTDFFAVRNLIPKDVIVIYTGAIDRFFDYKFGELSWRNVDFVEEVSDVTSYQGTTVINYADVLKKETRTHEFKFYHPERESLHYPKTICFHETSRSGRRGESPYYPVRGEADKIKLEKYQSLSLSFPNVIFGGRLGMYQYFDMHHVIGEALGLYDKIKKGHLVSGHFAKSENK